MLTPANYYDARLIELTTDADGVSMLVLEYNGEVLRLHTIHQPREIGGDRPWLCQGTIGVAQFVPDAYRIIGPLRDKVPRLLGVAFYRFTSYHDQTLRRAGELDGADPDAVSEGRVPNVIGWRSRGRGFRAPLGLIPGGDGGFIPDRTVPVTLRVPPEFVTLCRDYGLGPADMLRGFIADAAGLHNYFVTPRADGYSSNGSDERDHAEQWIWRAYGPLYEDAQQAIADAERAEEEREEREAEREDLESAVDGYCDAGGTIDELCALVGQLTEAKAAGRDEPTDHE